MFISVLGLLTFAILTTALGIVFGYILCLYLNTEATSEQRPVARNMREARAIERGLKPREAIIPRPAAFPNESTESDTPAEPRIISPTALNRTNLKELEGTSI